MPTYISLNNFTDKGIQTLKESPGRLAAFKKALEDAGGKFIGFYLTMGRYDSVLIVEGPSDEVAAALALSVGGQGNIRTETLKAFTEAEYREILAKMP
jgi:uncharacterized protein with GYD domain